MFICDNLKIEVKIMNKLIAISTNGSNSIALVKSVNEQEYKKLINEQEKNLSKGEKKAREHEEQHKNIDKELEHFTTLQCVLAKSVYDNFVDRGLIENDDQFQQMWYDFYFNGGLINTENAPKEYKDILAKVVAL